MNCFPQSNQRPSRHLEASTLAPEPIVEDAFDADLMEQGWLDPRFNLPRHPERHLLRRPVAPPPLRRPVTLGELIEQLETIAAQLETDVKRQLK